MRKNNVKLKKKVTEFVGFQIIKYIAGVLYFAGLAALIPLVPLVFSPVEFVRAQRAFLIALALILAGFLLVYWFSRSKKVALQSLGMMTLIPGLVGVFLLYSGPRRMSKLVAVLEEAPLLVEKYMTSQVPHAWLLAGVYIILGVLLVWFSYRVRN